MKYHDPLYVTHQEAIIRAVPEGDWLIIIESVCLDESEIKRELSYVKSCFK